MTGTSRHERSKKEGTFLESVKLSLEALHKEISEVKVTICDVREVQAMYHSSPNFIGADQMQVFDPCWNSHQWWNAMGFEPEHEFLDREKEHHDLCSTPAFVSPAITRSEILKFRASLLEGPKPQEIFNLCAQVVPEVAATEFTTGVKDAMLQGASNAIGISTELGLQHHVTSSGRNIASAKWSFPSYYTVNFKTNAVIWEEAHAKFEDLHRKLHIETATSLIKLEDLLRQAVLQTELKDIEIYMAFQAMVMDVCHEALTIVAKASTPNGLKSRNDLAEVYPFFSKCTLYDDVCRKHFNNTLDPMWKSHEFLLYFGQLMKVCKKIQKEMQDGKIRSDLAE